MIRFVVDEEKGANEGTSQVFSLIDRERECVSKDFLWLIFLQFRVQPKTHTEWSERVSHSVQNKCQPFWWWWCWDEKWKSETKKKNLIRRGSPPPTPLPPIQISLSLSEMHSIGSTPTACIATWVHTPKDITFNYEAQFWSCHLSITSMSR